MIGDPSGKSVERSLLDEATLQQNVEGIQRDLQKLLFSDPQLPKPLFLNNISWFQNFSFIHFLRDVGKHFRISSMLGKESVRTRLETEEGMSFTEFSYQLLQAYDFYHLFTHHQVSIQIGGSDQWGNITAGCELVRKLTGKTVYGLTLPLLVKSNGQKFGKSEKGALWLSSEKLSEYELYQYLFRIEDRDVIRMLRMLTFLDMDEIRKLEHAMTKADYVPNTCQKILATEVIKLVHGEVGALKAVQATEAAQPGKEVELTADGLEKLLPSIPHMQLSKDLVIGKKLIDVIALAQFLESKGEARRLIRNAGLYLNNKRIDDEQYEISAQDCVEDKFLLFALGKKNKALIKLL
jgi:tyrosyl-tRNA synthetase